MCKTSRSHYSCVDRESYLFQSGTGLVIENVIGYFGDGESSVDAAMRGSVLAVCGM